MNGFATAIDLIANGLASLVESPRQEIGVWFLAWIFIWSGISKLRKPTLAAMAMVDFGIVRHVQPVLGSGLGALELILAFSLAMRILPQFILGIVAGLLIIFTILIARSLWQGEQFACFCFGEADSELSKWTLGRTVALALLASILTLVAPPSDRFGLTVADVPLAIIALSTLGNIVLVVQIPHLLRGAEMNTRKRKS